MSLGCKILVREKNWKYVKGKMEAYDIQNKMLQKKRTLWETESKLKLEQICMTKGDHNMGFFKSSFADPI